MQRKLICAGHVCLDITPVFAPDAESDFASLLTPGRLVHTGAADIHTGGSVANTGLALKLLGNDVTLLGKIGTDAFGSIVKSIFASYDAGGLIEDRSATTSYSVVLAPPGQDRVFLHHPGANDTFSSADVPEDALKNAALFHFGYPPIMRRMYENGGAELAALFRRVKAHGVATGLDLAAVDPDSDAGRADWERILSAVLPDTDFFMPSFEELCRMLDRERYARFDPHADITEQIDLLRDAKPLAERALDLGCRVVLIKCGVAGMYLRTADRVALQKTGNRVALDPAHWADREILQPCLCADRVLSGTGAGDTSIAAFLTAVLNGCSPEWCAALAAAEGACCVTEYDALSGLLPLTALSERLKKGWKTMKQGEQQCLSI